MAASRRPDAPGRARASAQTGPGAQAHEVTVRRTRTMMTEGTQEFEALSAEDVASFNDVASKAPASLGAEARGVSRLSGASSQGQNQGEAGMPRALLIVGALLAVAVVIGGFFLFRAAISSLDGSASSEESAVYAVDDFSLIARVDDAGGLASVYLAYVDSINGRCELCYVDGASRIVGVGGSQARSLADLWASEGLQGVVRGVAQATGVEAKTAMQVSGEELSQILEIAESGLGGAPVDALVAGIGSKAGQMITPGALRGLLVTMGDVGHDGYIVLNAPTETVQDGALVYQQVKAVEWSVMLAGMRDSAGSVTAGL